MSKNTRKPLSEERKQDASRLRKIWDEFRKIPRSGKKVTQDDVSEACEWKTQGAFSAYLNARTPLNLEALLKLANYFNVPPSDISPELAKEISTVVRDNHDSTSTTKLVKIQKTIQLINELFINNQLTDKDIELIDSTLEASAKTLLENLIKPPKTDIEAQKTA